MSFYLPIGLIQPRRVTNYAYLNNLRPMMRGPGFIPVVRPSHSLCILTNPNMRATALPGSGNQPIRGAYPPNNQSFIGQSSHGSYNVGGDFTGVPYNPGVADSHSPCYAQGNDPNMYVRKYVPETAMLSSPPNPPQYGSQRSANGEQNDFYCDLCDLQLTSAISAQEHFNGRRHGLVANKICKPSGAGYYNTEGKWVRTATKYTAIINKVDEAHSTSDGEAPKITTPGELRCKMCNIAVSSKAQMDQHLSGAKHAQKLKLHGLGPTATVNEVRESFLDGTDFSMYRTPDGHYYCMLCDIKCNYVGQLKEHMDGRKHQRKALRANANKKH